MIAIERALVEPLGELRGGGETFTHVTADSREAGPGSLFVAVRGGIDFVDDAIGRGAAALAPRDAQTALAALARAVRERSGARVVGITGSVGKTSTKDLLAALCRPVARTIATPHGYNAELGVPLTVCMLEQDTEVAVVRYRTPRTAAAKSFTEVLPVEPVIPTTPAWSAARSSAASVARAPLVSATATAGPGDRSGAETSAAVAPRENASVR